MKILCTGHRRKLLDSEMVLSLEWSPQIWPPLHQAISLRSMQGQVWSWGLIKPFLFFHASVFMQRQQRIQAPASSGSATALVNDSLTLLERTSPRHLAAPTRLYP
jgi:hypothetical protein